MVAHVRSPELEFVDNQTYTSREARFADVMMPACTNWNVTNRGVCNSGNGGYQSIHNGCNWQIVVFQDKAIEPLLGVEVDYGNYAHVAERSAGR
jgi:trimethylamine-N-oxide reductase (cytochrome c)